mgnify:CR=1 FL=1
MTKSFEDTKIVEIGDPILRTPARPLFPEEILSEEIQNLIQIMKATMRKALGIGLAAPQIGLSLQLIVIEDKKEYYSSLDAEQIAEHERTEIPFHVVINPKLTVLGGDVAEFFEDCLSFPGWMAVVPRAKSVHVEYLNEEAKPCEILAKGWYARILQHEIDHVNGILYLDRAYPHTLMSMENNH